MTSYQDKQGVYSGVQKIIKDNTKVELQPAVVTAVRQDDSVSVQLFGSKSFKVARVPRGIDLEINDNVLVAFVDGQANPVVVISYDTRTSGRSASPLAAGDTIAPPINVAGFAWSPLIVGVRWQTPAGFALSFDVQYGVAADPESIDELEFTTERIKGSLFITQATEAGEPFWFRARSVSSGGKISGWSQWEGALSVSLSSALTASVLDLIITDESGDIIVDEDGNVVYEEIA
jgi:hypothetical protein